MTHMNWMRPGKTAAMAAPDPGGSAPPDAAQTAALEAERPPEPVRSPDAAQAQRAAELDSREAQIAQREMRARVMETLAARQLPAELAQLLDYASEERCSASLSSVQRIWQQAVQKGVETRVAGSAPKAGTGKSAVRSSMRDAISAYYNK